MRSTRTLFDLFPNEIIFSIFDYLSNNDIIYTFFYFNQRFNDLLFENTRYFKYLELPRTNLEFWKDVLSQIDYKVKILNITSIDLSLPLAYFSDIESLIISSRHGFPDEELERIFYSDLYKNLQSFQIKPIETKCDIGGMFYQDTTSVDYVLRKIFFSKNSLKTFEYLLETSPLKIPSSAFLEQNYNLQSLTLLLIDFKDIYTLLLYTPNLQELNLQSEAPFRPRTFFQKIRINLKKLTLKILAQKQRYTYLNDFWYEQTDIEQLVNFIQQFSTSLSYLSLDFIQTVDTLSDADKLQQLLEPMIELRQFHLFAVVYGDEIDCNAILSKFNHHFWLDHVWSFGMYDNKLFTLPFRFDYFTRLDKHLNSEWISNSVKTIDLLIESIFDYNLLKEFRIKLPKLSTIHFSVLGSQTKELSEDFNPKELCFNSVTTASFTHYFRCSDPSSEIIDEEKSWLIYLLPNLKYLTLSVPQLPSIEQEFNHNIQHLELTIDTFMNELEILIEQCYVYFPNVQYLYFRTRDPQCIMEEEAKMYVDVLNNFKNLKALLIYNLNRIEFSGKLWSSFTEYDIFDEIRDTFEITVYERYILFSKINI